MAYDFDKMARDLVGDGKKPNIFFVTSGKTVVGVLFNEVAAISAARALGETRRVLVEDRLRGEVWGNERHIHMQRVRA